MKKRRRNPVFFDHGIQKYTAHRYSMVASARAAYSPMKRRNLFGFQSARAPKGKYHAPGLIQTGRQRRVAKAIRHARLYRPGALTGTRPSSALGSDVVLALKGQGYRSADAKRAVSRASGSDFESLFRSAMGKIRGNPMSKKKKSKKKRNRRPRKGVMPPALRRYWAKKRAAKQNRRRKRKNPGYHRASTVMPRFRRRKLRSRSGKRVRSKRMAKAILLSKLRAEGYSIAPKKNKRRRKRNPPKPKLRSVRIHAYLSPKARREVSRALSRASGMRVKHKFAGGR